MTKKLMLFFSMVIISTAAYSMDYPDPAISITYDAVNQLITGTAIIIKPYGATIRTVQKDLKTNYVICLKDRSTDQTGAFTKDICSFELSNKIDEFHQTLSYCNDK